MRQAEQSKRIKEIDAARGLAMLAACLSHSAVYVTGQWDSALGIGLFTIGMLATPTFLLLSGITCGYLGTIERESIGRFRWRLIDRGLFLLLVGHLLLGLVHATWSGVPALTDSFYITDAVAVGLLIAAFVVGRASSWSLARMGILLFAFSCVVGNIAASSTEIGRGTIRLLFGVYDASESDEGWVVPLIPYLGVFLIGLSGGIEYARQLQRRTSTDVISRFCIRVGLVAMITAVALKGAWLFFEPFVDSQWYDFLHRFTGLRSKIPPGLAYILAYGGAGFAMVGVVGKLAATRWVGPVISVFALVGRTSLFVFFVQYLLYFFPSRVLHVGVGYWIVMLPLSLLIVWAVAWIWDRVNGNRLFTVGARRLKHFEHRQGRLTI